MRRRGDVVAPTATPKIIAYADPPYPGKSKKYYGKEKTYAGEVDHVELLAYLQSGAFGGWALSTSSELAPLRQLLALCGEDVRVAAWAKPIGVPPATAGMHGTWEPLLVQQARLERPGRRDSLVAQPARSGGTLMGRKSIAYVRWMLACVGARPGDTLVDLYPGTDVVGRSWLELAEYGSTLRYVQRTDERGARWYEPRASLGAGAWGEAAQ